MKMGRIHILSVSRRTARAALVAAAILGAGTALITRGARAAGDEHADASEHASDGHDDHAINWFDGFLGEREDIDEPNWMWRRPGTPVPYGAYLINTSILFYVLYRMGKKPAMDGLRQRRDRIMRGMDEAAKMKAEAAEQLAFYQSKLDRIETEVTRVRDEMRAAAKAERLYILAEAKERRERMESEARQMIVQELKAAREELMNEAVKGAIETAQRLLREQVNSSDHQRLSDDYVQSLKGALVNSSGGQA